jgi:hypothetical protein
VSGGRFFAYSQAPAERDFDGEDRPQDGKEVTPENRLQRQTLPLRHLQKEKPETCENPGAVVLRPVPEP